MNTVWINGRIHTLSSGRTTASALVARNGKIIYVGEDQDALRIAGSSCVCHDLQGRTVVPGFNDNHVHAVIYGDQLDSVTLEGLDGPAIVQTLRMAHPDPQPGQLIVAYNWDLPACPNPNKALLDLAFPDHPVLLAQFGGHGLWLNSAALAELDLEELRRKNPLGILERDARGELTGILKEMHDNPLLERHFDELFFRPTVREPRVLRALAKFASYGITSIQDNSWYRAMAGQFAKLRQSGRLTCRVSCWTHAEKPRARIGMAFAPFDKQWVRPGPWKYFLDGTFSTRTAALHESYAGEPENLGRGMNKAEILAILRFLAKTGRQGAFHAIGDRVISTFIEAAYEAQAEFPRFRTLRMRLEHAQLIRPEDWSSLRELGILVSAQPSALATPEKDIALLGPDRAQRAYPYRSLLDAQVDLSFGSDIPGEPSCNPLEAIGRVCTRPGPERISALEALEAYTVGSAWAEFQEDVKGRLKAGMFADFVVLDQDILSIAPEQIAQTKVLQTVVGGRVVYDAAKITAIE